jgi:hypothetical protein
LVAQGGRIWILDNTSAWNVPDGPYDPPRRTIIYRRDIEPAPDAVPSPASD